MSYICSRKTNSTEQDAVCKEPKKASALVGLDTCGGDLLFFARVECIVCTLHLQHKFCVKGKKCIFYPAF